MKEMNVIEIFHKEHLPGSTVSVVYDAYSSAWQIALLLLRYGLENGYFGIVSNYSVPLSAFIRKAETVGIDIRNTLEKGEMAIIDFFGSRYLSKEELPNVFYLDKVEPETLNPKIERIHDGPLKEYLSEKLALRMIYTLDGASLLLGEDNTLKLLNQTLASKSIRLRDSTLVLAINRDVVSQRFVAWVTSISDYVILAQSQLDEDGPTEFLYLIKAPYEEFEPTAYSFKVTKNRGMDKLKVRKISP